MRAESVILWSNKIVSAKHIRTVKRLKESDGYTIRDYLRECQSDWRYPNGIAWWDRPNDG